MRYWTYLEIRTKVREDLGLEQEEFIKPHEMLAYCNEAIDEAESEIHTIYKDYFLNYANISLVKDQPNYTLPTDIYANKIRSITYAIATVIYKVRRYNNMEDMFENIESDKTFNFNYNFRYFITNRSASTGVEINIVPTPQRNETNAIKLYYIRNANRMVDDTSICDIPEFVDFVLQYMKVRCYEKEAHPNLPLAIQVLQAKRKNMNDTLGDMVPDGENNLEQDFSHYQDMEI